MPERPPIHRRLAGLIVAIALIAGQSEARDSVQDPNASAAPESRVSDPAVPDLVIQVQNLAPDDRLEWVRASVPFPRGLVRSTPDWVVGGRIEDGEDTEELPTVWQVFGAKWPDGSWRQALCFFRAAIPALTTRSFELRSGTPNDEPETPFGLPPHALRFRAVVDGETELAELVAGEILEENAARKVQVFRGRFGETGLVAELVLTLWSAQDHADLSVAAFFSDPRTEAMELQIDELAIETDGVALVFRHARPLGVDSSLTELGTRHVLLRDDSLADGQGIRRVGILAPPIQSEAEAAGDSSSTLRAAALCPLFGATTWRASGAFGPLGVVPEPPPWMASPVALRAWLAERHTGYAQWLRTANPDPFRAPKLGPHRSPSTAGNQADFGVTALWEVAHSGLPSPLLEVEWSVLQEACRPVHVYEADATPVDPVNHPDWVVWSGRTHWNCKVSPDRLGKPCPQPSFDAHGWKGKDREHWSSNYLGAFYQLTGSPWALLQLRRERDLYLGGETLRDGLYTSLPGAARAAGRTMHSAAWIFLATGDDSLRERMRARMAEVNLPHWLFGDDPHEQLRPFDRKGPDPRYFEGSDDAVWVPWEETQTIMGFEAYLQTTGDDDPRLRNLTDQLAWNLLDHGYRALPDGGVEIGYVMRWNGGLAPEGEAANDPGRVHWNTNFVNWGLPALIVAEDAARRLDDPERAARAALLIERLSARRRPPRTGGTDDFVRWDARDSRDRRR